MSRRIETLFIPGPAGRLEALLEEPEQGEPRQAALVCHPHPLHGGTMHNKVVYRLARGLRQSGHVVLRFNFRGVNRSEGVHDGGQGEVEDAEAALRLLRQRYPALPYSLAGFSFGSRIALRLSERHPWARRAILVGFPAQNLKEETVRPCSIPCVFIHSRQDVVCPPEAAYRFYESLACEKQFFWIDGADHFFAHALEQLEQTIRALG